MLGVNYPERLFAAAETGNAPGVRDLLKKATVQDVNKLNAEDKVHLSIVCFD